MVKSDRSQVIDLAKGGLLCDLVSNLSSVHSTSPLSILILMVVLGFTNMQLPSSWSRNEYYTYDDPKAPSHSTTQNKHTRTALCFHPFFVSKFSEQVLHNGAFQPCVSVCRKIKGLWSWICEETYSFRDSWCLVLKKLNKRLEKGWRWHDGSRDLKGKNGSFKSVKGSSLSVLHITSVSKEKLKGP